MSCDRSADGDLGGFRVTDLTDRDDVGVWRRIERRPVAGHAGADIDLNPVDAVHPVFHRIPTVTILVAVD